MVEEGSRLSKIVTAVTSASARTVTATCTVTATGTITTACSGTRCHPQGTRKEVAATTTTGARQRAGPARRLCP